MNFWQQLQERKKLIKVFKKSGFYLGNADRYILPTIRSISPNKISFTPTYRDRSENHPKKLLCVPASIWRRHRTRR